MGSSVVKSEIQAKTHEVDSKDAGFSFFLGGLGGKFWWREMLLQGGWVGVELVRARRIDGFWKGRN